MKYLALAIASIGIAACFAALALEINHSRKACYAPASFNERFHFFYFKKPQMVPVRYITPSAYT